MITWIHTCQCLEWDSVTHGIISTCSPAFPSCRASPPSCCHLGCTWSCIAGQTHYPCRLRGDLGCPPVWWSAASAGPPGGTLWGRPALTWCQDTRPRHRLRCLSQVWRGGWNKRDTGCEEFRGGEGHEMKRKKGKKYEIWIKKIERWLMYLLWGIFSVLFNSFVPENVFGYFIFMLDIMYNSTMIIYANSSWNFHIGWASNLINRGELAQLSWNLNSYSFMIT